MASRRTGLADLTALQARDEIARGAVKAVELAEACLARIAEREPEVQAWAHLDPDYVMRQAEAADRFRGTGRPTGPLHGVPVGLKDIIDTRDLPTENGTRLRPGPAAARRRGGGGAAARGGRDHPRQDGDDRARRLHARQDAQPARSDAHARRLVLGLGGGGRRRRWCRSRSASQTNGSVIRPASFCGVVGFKPSRGLISRRGMLSQSETLDTVGVFARTIEDAALLADALAGYDDRRSADDPAARAAASWRPRQSRPPVKPSFALVRSPVWDKAEDDVREGFRELARGARRPRRRDRAAGAVSRTRMTGTARSTWPRWRGTTRATTTSDPALLSDRLRGMIEEGLAVRAVDYLRALDGIAVLNAGLEKIFDRYDAIVTPAAPGEAPVGEATGDPAFSRSGPIAACRR